MSVLDDIRALEENDPDGMLRHLVAFPDQLDEAEGIGRAVACSSLDRPVSSVVVLGMGGSAIGGELAAGYVADRMGVPFCVVRSYVLPDFVGRDTLVVASSYSGNTEETLAAYREATARGARVVCSTTGGELKRLAERASQDVIRVPAGLPPRAALAYSLVPLLVVLWRLELIRDQALELASAKATAARLVAALGSQEPAKTNLAKDLAHWLHHRVPVIYGTTPRTSVVATRWCGQLSENAKVVAHRNELPEMNHNEIVGWSVEQGFGGLARVIFLRDVEDHPRVARRIDITREALEASGVETREVGSVGDMRLERLVSLIQIGDFVSFYLAALAGVDPTPVVPIDRLKEALGSV